MLKPDSPSIGVLLTVHKRPHLLKDQLEAIRRQTVPATRVVIWDNASGFDYRTLELAENESLVYATANWGVWTRFLLAACMNVEFVAVFDDDTLPGHEWFHNCVNTIRQLPPFSLVGGVGVRFPDGTRENRTYHGWKNPSDIGEDVDLVGHAWFCERRLLDWFVVDHEAGPTCGEDYHISARAREKGGCVVVPPHPKDRLEMWSSLRGMEAGDDAVALYKQPGEEEKKQAVHQRLRSRGWKVVSEVLRAK